MNAILISIITFVSCTECPQDVRSFLNIAAGQKCDMVKWKLQMSDDGKYTLDAAWGYHVDNRTFKYTDELTGSQGTWKVNRNNPGFTRSEIYTLTAGDRRGESLSLLRLNSNIFQIMTKDGKMSKGGEGYSNMITRTDPVEDKSIGFSITDKSVISKDVVLTGRTPLKPFDKELPIIDNENHQKIKWMIKMYANGTVEVREILEHAKDWKGRWTVESKDAVIYKLDFEGRKLSLLKGNDDIYFFLSKDGGIVNGDREFGSCLIRRLPSGQ